MGVIMIVSNDLLLTSASIVYVFCAIPQLIRNLRFKDTITQSIMTNGLILLATTISLIAYINLNLMFASGFLVIEMAITIILLIQILLWRKNRKNKKMKELIKKTEGARSLIRSIKGVK
jgi:uncharacterized protein with PQ loop repeat